MSFSNFYKSKTEKHPLLMEIARFAIVGLIATIVDYIISALVLFLFNPTGYPTFLSFLGIGDHTEPTAAASVVSTGVGFVAGLIVNYLLSVLFIYINKGNSKTVAGFVMFSALSVGGLAINLLGMWLIYNVTGFINSEHAMILYWVVKILLTAIVLVYNYITRRVLIFKKSKVDLNSEDKFDEK